MAITHTARNIGQINVQIVFYIPSSITQTHEFKLITQEDSMESVKVSAKKFMNTYLVPSQVVGVSFFEDDHPNDEKNMWHASVFHKGSSSTEVAKPQEIKGDIYRQAHFSCDHCWDDVYDKVLHHICDNGIEDTRFVISTANSTTDTPFTATVT